MRTGTGIAKRIWLLTICALIGTSASWAAGTAPAALNSTQRLAEGKQLLESGKAKKAIKMLEPAVSQTPKNAELQYYLGKAYLKKKKYKKAKIALRTAMRLAPGTEIAKDCNQTLLNMPKKSIAPRLLRIFAKLRGRFLAPAGVAKPRVMSFYTDWAQPCQLLQPVLDKAEQEYGEKIEFVAINADDPKNEKLLEQYDISPVPTVVFLNTKGEIVTYLLGYSGEETVNKSIAKLIPKS